MTGTMSRGNIDRITQLRRRVRVIELLDAAERAGLSPIPILQFHVLAYLCNVLAPVWDMPSVDGKILKRFGGPYYPVLQWDVDRLVGMGVVIVSDVSYVRDADDRWRLEGAFQLNHSMSDRIVRSLNEFHWGRQRLTFVHEVAYALSALPEHSVEIAISDDATYSDPLISIGNVIDYGEWSDKNYSANAALHFRDLLPDGLRATPEEMLHLYVRHLYARMQGGR